jgi:hypothetical protein
MIYLSLHLKGQLQLLYLLDTHLKPLAPEGPVQAVKTVVVKNGNVPEGKRGLYTKKNISSIRLGDLFSECRMFEMKCHA